MLRSSVILSSGVVTRAALSMGKIFKAGTYPGNFLCKQDVTVRKAHPTIVRVLFF